MVAVRASEVFERVRCGLEVGLEELKRPCGDQHHRGVEDVLARRAAVDVLGRLPGRSLGGGAGANRDLALARRPRQRRTVAGPLDGVVLLGDRFHAADTGRGPREFCGA
jgi:hypothetical protein